MVFQFKKTFLIFLSIAFGGLIILGAIKITSATKSGASNGLQNIGDDIWKSALSVIPGDKSDTRVMKGTLEPSEVGESSATTTAIIARKLLSEYVLYQKNTSNAEISDADAATIASSLIQEVTLPPKQQYKLSDLNISSNNSMSAGISYKNSLNTLVSRQAASEKTENELTIVSQAMDSGDEATLEKLNTKVANYEQLIGNLLVLETPSSLAELHLNLLQSYETLRAATVGFQSILLDPAIGMAALTEYKSGVDALAQAEQAYQDFNYVGQ